MSPISVDDQIRFLISCVRWSNSGRVDFGEVAKECAVVSKGAAAKRYERLVKSHGTPNNPPSGSAPSAAGTKRRSGDKSSAGLANKKQKFVEPPPRWYDGEEEWEPPIKQEDEDMDMGIGVAVVNTEPFVDIEPDIEIGPVIKIEPDLEDGLFSSSLADIAVYSGSAANEDISSCSVTNGDFSGRGAADGDVAGIIGAKDGVSGGATGDVSIDEDDICIIEPPVFTSGRRPYSGIIKPVSDDLYDTIEHDGYADPSADSYPFNFRTPYPNRRRSFTPLPDDPTPVPTFSNSSIPCGPATVSTNIRSGPRFRAKHSAIVNPYAGSIYRTNASSGWPARPEPNLTSLNSQTSLIYGRDSKEIPAPRSRMPNPENRGVPIIYDLTDEGEGDSQHVQDGRSRETAIDLD